ncbi:ATP-binding cassette domain-containing protein [Actinomadura terrae]|uniref:ATP-binding cassette domain-containing protein n=1 Tax=Actinomadura terrae TaxID=604353 RepID=UPI002342C80A|nr:ATP-binding cassette domain-containing protein [Actinomadura terrae]
MELPTTGSPMIRAGELSKRYGRREVVRRLSFTVETGQVCALLGPNGAVKTSTIRMLVGLSAPDAGTATILGEPVGLGASVLSRVGVLIDGPGFVPHMTGMANLKLLWSATRRSFPSQFLVREVVVDGGRTDRAPEFFDGLVGGVLGTLAAARLIPTFMPSP